MLPKPSQYEVAKKEPRSVPPNNFDYSSCPSMSAEARNVAEELFKLVDKDSSGKISESDFAVASRIIEQYSSESLGLTFAEFGETSDGEVHTDRIEIMKYLPS